MERSGAAKYGNQSPEYASLHPGYGRRTKKPPRRLSAAALQIDHRDEGKGSVLGRLGSDLLFQVLRLSTIGAGEFNGRVRDGIGFRLPAKTTKPAKDRGQMSEIICQTSDVRGHPRSKLISV